MARERKRQDADVILGLFPGGNGVERGSGDPDSAERSGEVIDFAPFLAVRRQQSNAGAAIPPADPA